ncbi:MAG: hypothetical protein EBY22_07435 [Gammaproteobacteria bacterium]|nr:hypothetical protein [Gammaproteobacteria bacterium]
MPTSKDSINLRKTNLPILWLGIGGTGKLEKIRRAAASDSPTADVMGFSFEVKELQMHDDYKARIIIAPTHIEIDVSDFSMQEKQILPELLLRLTQHADVVQNFQGKQRLLVIRRAHAMSLSTAVRIRSTLEQFCMGANPTTCIWLSAREMNPAISFLEDLFVKVQCPKTPRSLEPPMLPYMRNIIEMILAEKSPPDIEIVMWTRECVYSLLGLNLSTLECIELLFRVLTEFYLSKRIPEEVYLKCLRTIGPLAGSASYRTPLLLESVFLDISQILLVQA